MRWLLSLFDKVKVWKAKEMDQDIVEEFDLEDKCISQALSLTTV